MIREISPDNQERMFMIQESESGNPTDEKITELENCFPTIQIVTEQKNQSI